MANDEDARSSSSITFSDDLVSRVDIAEVTESDDYQSLTTSAVLSHCKRKILRPYLRLLTVMGLRGFGTDRPNASKMVLAFGYIHLCQVVLFMATGYVLQYMTSFRRDCGFCRREYCGNGAYVYLVPSLLHFAGFLYALFLFRVRESEQLENLMERTFLLSAHRVDGPRKQQILVRNLWLFVVLGILWMMSSLASVGVMLEGVDFAADWVYSDVHRQVLKFVFIISTLWHDMVQATIITSYCLQIQLLASCSHFLRGKLLQHTIPPLSWMREINEYQNFLQYLNDEFAPAVCLFLLVDISWAASGGVWISRRDATPVDVVVATLWALAGVAPFVMASWLTSACTMLRRLGHEVRTRPFVYQDTPGEDLNAILLYTSTLKMKCKLFAMPVSGRYLMFFLAVSAISILTLGQCHILK